MEPLYEVLKVGSKKSTFSEKFIVEKTTSLAQDGIDKILSVSVGTFAGETAYTDNLIRYSGRVVFYVCYLDKEGVITKYETAENYSRTQAVSGDVCSYTVSVNAQKTDYDYDNGFLRLKSYLLADGEINLCQEVSVFSGGDNVVADKNEIGYVKSFGQKTGSYPVEEEFELPYGIKDVVTQNFDACLTSVQCGIGSIIVDGEVYLRLLLLQNQEKSDIIKEERTIPFRMEIECDEAMPQMSATARTFVKSLKTDVSVDETTGKSTVSASVGLSFVGEVFAEEKFDLYRDVFSTTDELEIERATGEVCIPEKRTVCDVKASGRCAVPEMNVGVVVLATCDEKFEVVNHDKKGDLLSVEGVLSLKAYLKDAEGVTYCKNLETPVSFSCNSALSDCEEKSVFAIVKNSYARLVSLTEIEIGANLIVSVIGCEKKRFEFIKKVTPIGEKKVCTSPISVYIPRPNEDLWSLAKRLGVRPEQLVSTNTDLQFPLTGDERIVVYRQK